jgi:hypothetical protein
VDTEGRRAEGVLRLAGKMELEERERRERTSGGRGQAMGRKTSDGTKNQR